MAYGRLGIGDDGKHEIIKDMRFVGIISICYLKVPMKRKLSFSYLNELPKLLGMLIWSSFIFHVVLEIFRLM